MTAWSDRRATKRDRARDRARWNAELLSNVDLAALRAALGEPDDAKPAPKGATPVAKGPVTSDFLRWTPVGPSVTMRGQAVSRPRVAGRVRDLAVSDDGRRAYAGSAMGGVWYTDDAGTSWRPVAGWEERSVVAGGANNAQSVGALLVSFGATAADDVVLVGTGEPGAVDSVFGSQAWGGLGVLVARGPTQRSGAVSPLASAWEPHAGVEVFEGASIFRLVRKPGLTHAQAAETDVDVVLAATSYGLYVGSRVDQAAPAPAGPRYVWARAHGLDAITFTATIEGQPDRGTTVTDVLWLPRAAQGRIIAAVEGWGVAFSDDLGASFAWVEDLNVDTDNVQITGRLSLARASDTSTVYALGAREKPGANPNPPDRPTLWRIADANPAAGDPTAATMVTGVPTTLWGAQRDYDQAIACLRVDGVDRVYLGGSTVRFSGGFAASLYCFRVHRTSSGAHRLEAVSGLSRAGNPVKTTAPDPDGRDHAGGDGAAAAGLIGDNVHADIHRLLLVGTGSTLQVWVGCDGGVFVSARAGRVHSFTARNTGLAVLQPGFVAAHPVSSHYLGAGFQDNGTQVRVGDTIWEVEQMGDGGGLAFLPTRPHYLVAQYVRASWSSEPTQGFLSPTSRIPGGGTTTTDREDTGRISSFYSAGASIAHNGRSRFALGTNRVWISDTIGNASNTWRVLPWSTAQAKSPVDARPGGSDPKPRFGVPADTGTIGPISNGVGRWGRALVVKWVDATTVVALFQAGAARWREDGSGKWTAEALAFPSPMRGTDIVPVPGTDDLLLTTLGSTTSADIDTLWRWHDPAGPQHGWRVTGLRRLLGTAPDPGPLEPAYAVVVDSTGAGAGTVYVGTALGVRKGLLNASTGAIVWDRNLLGNGLPQAVVQDLSLARYTVTGGTTAHLLRAAIQSRGVWEVDLGVPTSTGANPAAEQPRRTWLRAHDFDDRRLFPTPTAHPRRAATATGATLDVLASPDIRVRPAPSPTAAPRWPLAASAKISSASAPNHQLWTFQTAFRWLYPAIAADGRWSPVMAATVRLHRAVLDLSNGAFIDRALWEAVLDTRIDPTTGAVSTNAGHPRAVYREPWHSPLDLTAAATEADLRELVVPASATGITGPLAYAEPVVVDVLVHHRDLRRQAVGTVNVGLLTAHDADPAALRALDIGNTVAWARAVATGATPPALPADWTPATRTSSGTIHHSWAVPAELDAYLPRAVSIPLDLSGRHGESVLVVAVAGSVTDPCTTNPLSLPSPARVEDLVTRWPHAAALLLRVQNRPT